MRWARTITAASVVAWLMAGCGGDQGDQLVLQFLNFENPTIGQPDVVNPTLAEVDIVQDLCPGGSFEPFAQTQAGAVFINHGGSDILLDLITITIPNSGVVPLTRHISQTIVGGHCGIGSAQSCAVNADCNVGGVIGTCVRTESTVSFLLYDLATKDLVSPGTYDVTVTFSGEDASGSRFTVSAKLTTTFADFFNCG